MTFDIALLLSQDGITAGAVYALLAMTLVMLFTVTRVIFLPQGEFVAFGALTLVDLQAGRFPGVALLLLVIGVAVALVDAAVALRRRRPKGLPGSIARNIVLPLLVIAALWFIDFRTLGLAAQIAIALLVVVPLGPMIYRLAFQPISESSVLVLLIVAVAVHLALVGLGLMFFGPEGSRVPAFVNADLDIGGIPVSGQALMIVGASLVLIILMNQFFARSMHGKALRATASNRVGARLMGIPPAVAGRRAFTLAALIGAISGILIAPITTTYYDTGFLIGLKGFVAAIIGGLVSYPLAAAGAILVGLLESYAAFYSSAFKEVIVFTLIIPVLLWRSLRSGHALEDQ